MREKEGKGSVEAKRVDGSWSDGCCSCITSALGQISVFPSHAWSPVSPRDEAPDFWVRQPSSATCWLCSSGQVAWSLWAFVSLLVNRDKMWYGCEQWIQPCMCKAHMQGVAQGKSPCVGSGAPVLGAGVPFGLKVWLLLRSVLSAGAAGWWSSVLHFLAFLSFLFISTWPAHPAYQAFVVSANLPCH